MGRIGISYSDVAQAAREIQGSEINVTVDNIRNALGTGSKSTIARHLKAWRETHQIHHPNETALPTDLLALVKGLWTRCQEKADQQIDQHQKETDNALAAMREAKNFTEKDLQVAQAQMLKLEEEYQTLNQQTQLQEQDLIAAQKEISHTESRVQSLEEHLSQEQSENARLHALLHHMQTNLEEYQSAVQAVRDEQQLNLEKQRSEYEQRIREIETVLTAEKEKRIRVESSLNQTQQQLDTVLEQDGRKTHVLNELQQAITTLQTTTDMQEKRVKSLSQKNQALLQEQLSNATKMAAQQAALEAAQQQSAKLEQLRQEEKAQIQLLHDKNIEFMQGKAVLESQLKQLEKQSIT